jgi:hypothetical protein
MNLKRWLYRDGHPNWVARTHDRGTAALYALGVAPDYLVTLEVRGRRSGRNVALPLVMAAVENERYLVSMLGEGANWVRNVRAAGGDAALRHGRREEVRLEELVVERRARTEDLSEAGAERQGARAGRQGRAVGRVRAGGGPVPRVSGRAQKRGVSPPSPPLAGPTAAPSQITRFGEVPVSPRPVRLHAQPRIGFTP